MADKISTLILIVDLECCRCYKKIRKVIAKFPEIQSQIFDEKNNKVFVSGPFDPEKLKRKLCCKACKYIKDIQIKPPEKPKPEPKPKPAEPAPKPVEPAPKPAPKPVEPAPKPVEPAPKPKPVEPAPKPVEPEPTPKPVEPAPPPKPVPPPPEPVPPVAGIPVGPYAPMVCCRPCYEGHPEHGICTRFGYERGTCNYTFFSEEDPSCSIM